MSITADGRPVLSNTYGILFKQTGGTWVEGIYMGSNNRIIVGGPSGTNVPVVIYNKLNVDSILTTREQLGLLSYHPTDWTGVSNTQVGVGTPDSQLVLRSNSSDLLHYRDGVHCLIFDSYNFSRNLGTTSLNSSFNHFPMMAAQPTNSDATTDRGYPIQNAGSLIVIPGVYGGSSQIYGTYDSNRWFVRGGSPTLDSADKHTAWKELATTSHLSNYLPLTGGTLTGSLNIGDSSQNVYNYIRIRRNNYTFETTVSEGSGILSLDSSNSGVTPTTLKISPGGHAYINDKELATTSRLSNYLPLSGGTMSGNIMFPTSEVYIVQTLASTSNYGAPIRWMVGNETRAMIGYHTTGGDGTAGAIIITPTNPGSSPWVNGNGLFIDRNKIYFNGSELAKVSQIPSTSNYLPLSGGVLSGSDRIVLRINSPSSAPAVDLIFSIGNSTKGGVGFESGTLGAFLSDGVNDKVFCLKNGPEIRTNSGTLIGEIPYKSDLDKYLPLTGGTLTERLTVPRINTNYIESIDGNALLAYHQAGVDGVTNTQVGIGTVVDQMILRSSNTNLMHYKNGTQYTILDTSNIAALTIQFNGSTNTTYAPNAAKTVNITPAAIGAAASSHTHNYAASPSAGGPATYILDSGGGNNNIQLAYKGYGLTASTASHLVGIDKTLVNGCRVFRDIAPSEVRTLIEAAAVGHTHVMSDISGLSLAWSSITGKPETATRWPSWSEVTNKPINPSYSFGGNNDSITTAQFLTHLQNLGAFSTGFGIYRGSWSYRANQSITDTGVGVIHLAGSTVEVIGNSASNCTIRVTVPTTSGNGTTKRIYVYCNNGDEYKPGWFAVARTDELTWNSISGKPSTFTPSSHTHTKSQITDFPSSMPASDVYAWAKASSKPSYSWSEITGKPSTFTPSSHTHPLSDISDLQASWDALLKAAPSA